MNKLTLLALIAGIVTITSCGSSQNVNGNWNAEMLNPDGSFALTFFADLKQSGGTVDVSNFNSGPPGTIVSCFGTSALNETARLSSGHFAMTVSTLSLRLQTTLLRYKVRKTAMGTSQERGQRAGSMVVLPPEISQ